MFVAVTWLVEGLSVEKLLTVKVENSVTCLVNTWRLVA
jgi:hypothetical protein